MSALPATLQRQAEVAKRDVEKLGDRIRAMKQAAPPGTTLWKELCALHMDYAVARAAVGEVCSTTASASMVGVVEQVQEVNADQLELHPAFRPDSRMRAANDHSLDPD